MDEIVIQTPARLHFGLLDLNGGLGRIDGGIGLALEQPRTVIAAWRSETIHATCPMERAIEKRLNAAVRKVCAFYELPGASVEIKERAKPHSGLGSASQTLVAQGSPFALSTGLNRARRRSRRWSDGAEHPASALAR